MPDDLNVDPGTNNTDPPNNGGRQDVGGTFLDGLPENLRGNEALKGFNSVEDLAGAFLETSGKVPQVPEKPDAYEIPNSEVSPMSPELMEGFRSWAHEAGLSVDQAKTLASKWNEFADHQTQAMAQAEEAAISTLKTEWAGNFDKNVADAARALSVFAGKAGFKEDEIKGFLNETRLGSSPVMLKLFHALANAMSEDQFVDPAGQHQPDNRPKTAAGKPMLSFPSMEK